MAEARPPTRAARYHDRRHRSHSSRHVGHAQHCPFRGCGDSTRESLAEVTPADIAAEHLVPAVVRTSHPRVTPITSGWTASGQQSNHRSVTGEPPYRNVEFTWGSNRF